MMSSTAFDMPPAKIAGAEGRHHRVLDDQPGMQVGQRAFEPRSRPRCASCGRRAATSSGCRCPRRPGRASRRGRDGWHRRSIASPPRLGYRGDDDLVARIFARRLRVSTPAPSRRLDRSARRRRRRARSRAGDSARRRRGREAEAASAQSAGSLARLPVRRCASEGADTTKLMAGHRTAIEGSPALLLSCRNRPSAVAWCRRRR